MKKKKKKSIRVIKNVENKSYELDKSSNSSIIKHEKTDKGNHRRDSYKEQKGKNKNHEKSKKKESTVNEETLKILSNIKKYYNEKKKESSDNENSEPYASVCSSSSEKIKKKKKQKELEYKEKEKKKKKNSDNVVDLGELENIKDEYLNKLERTRKKE